MVRIIRAPFFMISLLVGAILTFFILAWVSVGGWCEDALRWLGYRERQSWLPAVFGMVGYVGFGIAAPAYAGWHLIGWPGAIVGPILALAAIAVLGRW